MDATIVGEDDSSVAVDVTDGDALHHVGFGADGTVRFHSCDEFPDEADRTPHQQLRYERARRYAGLHAFREREFEVFGRAEGLEAMENPDRLTATAVAVASLPTDTLDETLDDFVRQVSSHWSDHDPVVEPPEGLDSDEPTVVEQDVYLDLESSGARAYASATEQDGFLSSLETATATKEDGEDEEDEEGALPERDDADPIEWVEAALEANGVDASDQLLTELVEPSVAGVGPLRVRPEDPGAEAAEQDGDAPDLQRPPDATLAVRPGAEAFGSLEEFRATVVDHLRRRIRDCYVATAQVPPADARVLGPGITAYTDEYRTRELLQSYHDPDESVEWERATLLETPP